MTDNSAFHDHPKVDDRMAKEKGLEKVLGFNTNPTEIGNHPGATSLVDSQWSDTSARAYQIATAGTRHRMGEHTGHRQPGGGPSSETPTTPEKTSSKRRVWVAAVVVLALCLIAAVTAAVVVSYRPSTTTVKSVEIVGEIVIREKWSDQLADKTSPEYQVKKRSIENELDKAFKAGRLRSMYDRVEVTGLRPGSIVVDISVSVNIPPDSASFENSTVHVSVEDSTTRVDITGVVQDDITNAVNLNLDTNRIRVRVSVTLKTTTSSPVATTANFPVTTATTANSQIPTQRTSAAATTKETLSATEITTTTTSSRTTTTTTSTTSPLTAILVTVVSNQSWSQDLMNKTSPAYVAIANEIRSQVMAAVNGTALEDRTMYIELVRLRPGSVVITCKVYFSDVEIVYDTPRPVPAPGVLAITMLDIHEIIHNASHSGGVLPYYQWEAADMIEATPIRFANGSSQDSPMSGRLEVYYNGTWGTICGDQVTNVTAEVLCGMLGFRSGVLSNRSMSEGGSGQIWFGDIDCPEGAIDISQCETNGWEGGDCDHDGVLMLVCSDSDVANEEPTPVRLVNGSRGDGWVSGRLEIYFSGIWGTVCDDGFTSNNSRVVCNQLGYRFGNYFSLAAFGQGNGQIWLDGIYCSGDENGILECSHSQWGVHDCSHSEDVGLVCSNIPSVNTCLLPIYGYCQGYYGCFQASRRCDGSRDCMNYFDESNCSLSTTAMPRSSSTSSSIRYCNHCQNNGVCFDYGNGIFKCHCPLFFTGNLCQYSLLSTRRPWTTQIPDFQCRGNTYECANGACVPNEWVCDGHFDCQLGSDESPELCGGRVTLPTPTTPWWRQQSTTPWWRQQSTTPLWGQQSTTPPWGLPHTTPRRNTAPPWSHTTRYPIRRVTDATVDCNSGLYQCGDGRCVQVNQRCDGTIQCRGGQDERGCVEVSENGTQVILNGEERTVCAGSSDFNNRQLGEGVCIYLGYTRLQSVEMLGSETVPLGAAFYPTANFHGYLGRLRPILSANCSPLVIRCAQQVTNCGRPSVPLANNYVQYGTDAVAGQWPWQAQLHTTRFICGGTILNSRWVMTAGHCVDGRTASDFVVKLGAHTLRSVEAWELQRSVSKLILHSSYVSEQDNGRPIYDIALLFLNESLPFSDFIQPACLPREPLNGKEVCYSTGWGDTETGSNPNILQQIRVTTSNSYDCEPLVGGFHELRPSMVCGIMSSTYSPVCYGDSGGPLVCLNKAGRWDVHGVTSFGPPRCRRYGELAVAVFSNVHYFRSWIESNMGCDFVCGDGECLYARESVCDGADDCSDGSDEGDFCEESVSCSFEYTNMCGYTVQNETNGNLTWVNTDLQYHFAANKTDERGWFTRVVFAPDRYRQGLSELSVLRSPSIPPSSRPSCLRFYFELLRGGQIQVWAVDQSQRKSVLWSLAVLRGQAWTLGTVTLPAGTVMVEFRGTLFTAIDDVELKEDHACPPIVCTGDSEVACNSPSFCMDSRLLCDSSIQCADDPNTLDEDPEYCGASVNCTFKAAYICGYKPVQGGLLAWIRQTRNRLSKPRGALTDQSMILSISNYTASNLSELSLPITSSLLFPDFRTTDAATCLEFSYVFFHDSQFSSNFLQNKTHTAQIRLINSTGAQTATLWSRVGNQGHRWRLAQVTLPAGTHNFSIVGGIFGPSQKAIGRLALSRFNFDVEVDDFNLKSGPCLASVISCSTDEFRCGGGHCLPVSSVCDGVEGCDSGEDEPTSCVEVGTYRLVGGGPHEGQGRIEWYSGREWRGLCSILHSGVDHLAAVVCSSLGFGRENAYFYQPNRFDQGPFRRGDRIDCLGEENSTQDCIVRTGYYCPPGFTSAVSCTGPANMDFVVRLRTSDIPWQGIVEINYNDTWGPVCNSGFDLTAANITCRMLGYSHAHRTLDILQGPNASLPLLSGLRCTGNERYLHECDHDPWGAASCSSSQHAAVECFTKEAQTPPTLTGARFRLAEGNGSSGRVEVFHDNQWGTICDDYATNETAALICQGFGFGQGYILSNTPPGSGPIWLDDVYCSAFFTGFLHCISGLSVGRHDCNHYEDLGVECFTACSKDQYLCTNQKVCIEGRFVCDGDMDCPDGDDELNCESNCDSNQYVCPDGRCLLPTHRCNGNPDCSDGADEIGCVRLNSDSSVQVTRNSETRHLCVSEDSASDLAAVVCRISSFGSVSSFSTTVNIGEAWLASPSAVNNSVLPGFALQNNSQCSRLLVTCSPSVCSNMGQTTQLSNGPPTPGSWPWHVRIWSQGAGFRTGNMCDGTLVEAVWVLTSDSCFRSLQGKSKVGGGTWTVDGPEWQADVIHFVRENPSSPMVLLRLAESEGRNMLVLSACLPAPSDRANTHCYITTQQSHRLDWSMTTRHVRVRYPYPCSYLGVTGVQQGQADCVIYKPRLLNNSVCSMDAGIGSAMVCRHPSGRWLLEAVSWRESMCGSLSVGGTRVVNSVSPVRESLSWINKITECPFRCLDGTCLYDLDSVCDGERTCSQGEDEGPHCDDAVTCSFDYFNNCGYHGGDSMGQHWIKVRPAAGQSEIGDHSRTLGAYFIAQNGATSSSRVTGGPVLTSPEITSLGMTCFIFHFIMGGSPYLEMDVIAMEAAGNTTLLQFAGEYSYSWRQALVTLNSTLTRPLRLAFVARNMTRGTTIAIDDVQLSSNCDLVCEEEDFRCGDSFCLAPSSVCDGLAQCPDQMDEDSCTVGVSCDFEEDVCGYSNNSLPGLQGEGWLWSNTSGIPEGAPNMDHTQKASTVVNVDTRIRLVNGVRTPYTYSGRLEVIHEGEWGTVCDDGFGPSDARVVCRMLGFGRGVYRCCGGYGWGTGTIWLGNLACFGTEGDIFQCRHSGWGVRFCSHSEDVGVVCSEPLRDNRPIISESASRDIRLVNGDVTPTSISGRLEILHSGVWGTVCDDGFGLNEARVACRMLGFRNASCCSRYGSGTGQIWLDDVDCLGWEPNLAQCDHRLWGSHNCDHYEDVGLTCTDPDPASTVLQTLLGQYLYTSGFSQSILSSWFTNSEPVCLEFYYLLFGNYSSVGTALSVRDEAGSQDRHVIWEVSGPLDKTWRLAQANVSPGFHRFNFINTVYFQAAIDDIRVIPGDCVETVISCDITEYMCQGTTICIPLDEVCNGRGYCPSGDDEIHCNTSTVAVRVVPETASSYFVSRLAGYLEFFYDQKWRTFSYTQPWDRTAANVACRQLGLGLGYTTSRSGEYEYRWSMEISCGGSARNIEDCFLTSPRSTYSSRSVYIYCDRYLPSTLPSDVIRLVDGEAPNEGRLEVKMYNQWGTVCDDGFSDTEARAICLLLGYRGEAEIIPTGIMGNGSIWLDDLVCISSIFSECTASLVGTHDCTHYEDISLKCEQECNPGFNLCSDQRTCINANWTCDGDFDCDDGSDEANCHNCTGNEFTCRNYACIPADGRCDGIPDCADSSDEERCLHVTDSQEVMVVRADGEWRTLCGDEDTMSDLADDACYYLGYRSVESVSLGSDFVDGIVANRSNTNSGIFMGFTLTVSSACKQLLVKCGRLECGLKGYDIPDKLTFSNKRSEVGEWPWIVHIGLSCTGVLIKEDWVLTSTCDDRVPLANLTARFGVQNLRHRGDHEEERRFVRRVDYSSMTLFLLSSPVTVSPYIRPACTPPMFASPPNDCYTIGWERSEVDISGNPVYDDFLHEVRMQIYPDYKCSVRGGLPVFPGNDSSSNANITGPFVCAMSDINQQDPRTCASTIAGPLLCRNRADRWEIWGMPSTPDIPGLPCRQNQYRSVSDIRDWIDETTACPFTCGDKCIYNPDRICDGVDDCTNGEDEATVCQPSVDCTFSYPNVCGYRNVSSVATSVWVRGSFDTTSVRDLQDTTYGTYLYVFDYYTGITPAEVETPGLNLPLDQPGCVNFYVIIRGAAKLIVVAVMEDNNAEVLDLSGNSQYGWRSESSSIPPGTRRLRFVTSRFSVGFVALDDVLVTEGLCGTSDCEGDEFRCTTGLCVSNTTLCDGVNDCVDGSDEAGCGESVDCDFESGYMCGYTWDKRLSSWGVGDSGDFRSPTVDHTLKTDDGHYAWPWNRTPRGILVSPPFTISTESCVTFYYYQSYGNWDIQLHAYSNHHRRLMLRPQQQVNIRRWRLVQANLLPENDNAAYRLIFETQGRGITLGRVYLDDVRVIPGACDLSVSPCSSTEFQCGSGECIPQRFVCDYTKHCADNSDEDRDCDTFIHPVRLVGGGDRSQGRLEILYAGRWGSICGYLPDRTQSVVCRMLNFSGNAFATGNPNFGEGPPYWLDSRMFCDGSESRLTQCRMLDEMSWGIVRPFCHPALPVGLRCDISRANSTANNVRLVGQNGWEGRVEIYHDEQWGTVCDEDWDLDDARVVCRMMGYGPEAMLLNDSEFEDGRWSTPIWMSGVSCAGDEARLESCRFFGWQSHSCTHSRDVGVRCLGGPGVGQETVPRPAAGRIRLAGGSTPNRGRVEVQFGQIWGTICDDNVTDTEVSVICRTLGYSEGELLPDVMPGSGQIWLDNLNCSLSQSADVFSCSNSGIAIHDCDHLEDLVVSCFDAESEGGNV